MARRKCVLRACPHHHYGLEKIGGNTVKPHPFPRNDYSTWSKWYQFAVEHNGSLENDKSLHFLCSAHFQPDLFKADGSLTINAEPTISPEFVRLLALKNGDVSHPKLYPLPEKKSSKSTTPVVFLNDVIEGFTLTEQQLSSSQPSSFEHPRKQRMGDLCACEFVCPVQTKVGLQIINDTLRIWGNLGKCHEKQKVDRKALKGKKIEVVEKCKGRCYAHSNNTKNQSNNKIILS